MKTILNHPTKQFLFRALLPVLFILLAIQETNAQTGYIYVHAKTLSEDLLQSFNFSVSGGPTSVSNFTLLDNQLNIEPTDIGAGHGTGSGELWIVAGATLGAPGYIYHRSVNSTVWNKVSTTQKAVTIDGADLNHFVMVDSVGDAYMYNGSSFTMIYNHNTYGMKATDIANNGSITNGTGFTAIVTSNGHVGSYTGNYSSTFTWSDITPVDNSGGTFSRLDVNPTTKDIILTDWSGYVTKVNSSGGSLVYYGRGGTASSYYDVAVDGSGNVYGDASNSTGIGSVYRYNGTSWIEEPTAIHHFFFTCGDAGQAWTITGVTAAQQSSYATPSSIFTRTGDGSGTWLDDERVQTTQNDNAIMIPVAAGTYTITEASLTTYNLQDITIYDPTSGSTKNVAANKTSVVVAAGQIVHVIFTNGLVSPTALSSGCGSTLVIENFGSGAAGTKGNPLSGLTDYHYWNSASQNTMSDGYYSLSQNSSQWSNAALTDHSGLTGGYFMLVNASFAPDMFYRRRITGLIPGTTYVMYFYGGNLSTGSPLQPNITAGIRDTSSGATLGSINTGWFPTDNAWHQYTFSFTATVTTGDIFLQNNAPGGSGNDLAIDDITITSVCNVLPVTLVDFSAQKQNNNVLLKWSTTSTVNFDHFEVERSTDGVNWTDIGKVAGQGNSASVQNYSYTDRSPLNGTNYYRLKAVDLNGKTIYSQTKTLDVNGIAKWTVAAYPNPADAGSIVTLQSNKPIQTVRMLDVSGKVMMTRNIAAAEGQGKLSTTVTTSNLPSGLYLLQITDAEGNISNIKLVKKGS